MEHESNAFRVLAILSFLTALLSSLLIAMVDAATVAARLAGTLDRSRPLWLHTFSIAMITAGVALTALAVPRVASRRAARVIYAVVAVLNLSVPILQGLHHDIWPMPALDVVAAALMLGLAVTARPHRPYRRGRVVTA